MKKLSVVVAIFMLVPAVLYAQDIHKLYFSQTGKLTDNMSVVAYIREYQVIGEQAKVQDFYYPSRKKYSDVYHVPLIQVKQFIPKLNQGTLTLWYFNGQKKTVTSYQNGLPHGTWIKWYSDGKKMEEIPFVRGKTEGVGARYYRTGIKESEIEFRNNQANGKWKQWYINGGLKSEALMRNGRVIEVLTWDDRGKVLSEMVFEGDKRNGIVLDWYPNGAKRSEAIYQNDNLISKTVWDEQGGIVD